MNTKAFVNEYDERTRRSLLRRAAEAYQLAARELAVVQVAQACALIRETYPEAATVVFIPGLAENGEPDVDIDWIYDGTDGVLLDRDEAPQSDISALYEPEILLAEALRNGYDFAEHGPGKLKVTVNDGC